MGGCNVYIYLWKNKYKMHSMGRKPLNASLICVFISKKLAYLRCQFNKNVYTFSHAAVHSLFAFFFLLYSTSVLFNVNIDLRTLLIDFLVYNPLILYQQMKR